MTDKEMIEARCQQEGLTIQGWDEEHENGLTAKLGRYTVTTDDYEEAGFYIDDEGDLSACVVGSEQFGNRRVSFAFTPDEMDMGNDVSELSILDPVE